MVEVPSYLSEDYGVATAADDSCLQACMASCEVGNSGCNACQNSSCQLACQWSCQYSSEYCDSCESSCQTTCESSCQNCEGACETTCETSCQNCEGASCQTSQSCSQSCSESSSSEPDFSFDITSYDSESVTIKVYVDTSYKYYRIMYRYESSSTLIDTISKTATSNFTYTIDGLDPETDYLVNVACSDVNSDDAEWYFAGAQTFTTDPVPAIEPWSWTSSNGSATATQTKNAYTALTSGGAISDFVYQVWNDFIDKIYECRLAAGALWSEYYLPRADTKMASGDTDVTADRFNSAKENIGSMYSTGIWYDPPNNTKAYVETGDLIYGHYFTDLTDVLNEWIDTLNG